jgi:hypothetical protein
MSLYNNILNREQLAKEIKNILISFESKQNDILFKKGIYIFGSSGSGKTEFIMSILNDLNYDVIKYDAGDIRNKTLIDTITSNNISNCNVLQMMKGMKKKIAIVMDEIDGMNNGDKGGITSLIKLIRQKKTKKQKLENKTNNPIICIGNYYVDKKIKELIKVCNMFELKTPTNHEITKLLEHYIPSIKNKYNEKIQMVEYIQGDLRKLNFIIKIHENNPNMLKPHIFETVFHKKTFNEDTKKTTKLLLNNYKSIDLHNELINETDRTIIALLWHENIVDMLSTVKKEKSIPFYLKILNNICFADYMDRITFQNQIWQFNEMTSIIKTFYNNKLYHEYFPENQNKFNPTEVRFTKVLTKYSTEYNNILFVHNLCQELDLDKKDLIVFFQGLRIFDNQEIINNNIGVQYDKLFENYNISKLDIKRIYRYLDKNIKKEFIEEDLSEDNFDIA